MLTRKTIRRVLPFDVRQSVYNRIYYIPLAIIRLWGWHERECCICAYRGKFRAYGFPPAYDARCPSCNCLERHRLLKLWFDQHYERTIPLDLLHFAPEPCLRSFLRPFARKYVTADIEPGKADVAINIEQMDISSGTFDMIICSHVLEHVAQDRKALSELHRILKPGAKGILMVPIILSIDEIDEEFGSVDQAERWRRFGQFDHVRLYSKRGFLERVREAGFKVHELGREFFREDLFSRAGISNHSVLYIVQK